MKKKMLVITVFLLLNTAISVNAAGIIKVTSLDEFNTKEPAEKLNLKLRNDCTLGEYEFKTGDILECDVVKVVPPKRGKLNAKFYVMPYARISGEEEMPINTKLQGKYVKGVISKEELKQLDKGKIAKEAALKATSMYVKSTVPGATIITGMIKNEEGNRIKSGVKEAYKSSLFSRFEKGNDIYIAVDDDFCLLFKKSKRNRKSEKFIDEETEEFIGEETEEKTTDTEILEETN